MKTQCVTSWKLLYNGEWIPESNGLNVLVYHFILLVAESLMFVVVTVFVVPFVDLTIVSAFPCRCRLADSKKAPMIEEEVSFVHYSGFTQKCFLDLHTCNTELVNLQFIKIACWYYMNCTDPPGHKCHGADPCGVVPQPSLLPGQSICQGHRLSDVLPAVYEGLRLQLLPLCRSHHRWAMFTKHVQDYNVLLDWSMYRVS